MNPIDKALLKFAEWERNWAQEAIEKLISGKTEGLDIKKLRGREDIFRVRKGDIRIIYMKTGKQVIVLFAGRRNDKTYNS